MIHNKLSIGMTGMLIIIPILIILSTALQFSSILSDNFANNKGFQDACSSEEPICISSRVFSWLGVISTIIPLFMMLILGFCIFESELFRKKRKNLKGFFKSTRCQLLFVQIHNALLILLPLSILFQIIAISTEVENSVRTLKSPTGSLDPQEGFSLYVISLVLITFALLFHPAVNRQP